MTITKTLSAAACAIMVAGSAVAGGFEAVDTGTNVVTIPPTPPVVAGGSLPGWVIPAVIVAGLVAVATASDDS